MKLGDQVEVSILKVDTEERKIGLSRKRVEWAEEDEAAAEAAGNGMSTAGSSREPAMELKGGVGSADSGPLFKSASASESDES